jgi:hypothetical protein
MSAKVKHMGNLTKGVEPRKPREWTPEELAQIDKGVEIAMEGIRKHCKDLPGLFKALKAMNDKMETELYGAPIDRKVG